MKYNHRVIKIDHGRVVDDTSKDNISDDYDDIKNYDDSDDYAELKQFSDDISVASTDE